MNIKNIFSALLLSLAVLMPASARAAVQEEHVAENRVIYEVFVRNFSPAGNLKGVEAQIPRLKALGVDVIWLMPIYKLGDTGKWGTYSSPYAVKNYRLIDPDNGTEQDLRDLVKAIHAAGMEIWLDWVANHTSMDNEWVTSHPEYYSRNGSDFVHPHGWNDVYELARDNEQMQAAMIDAMNYWVQNFDIDGFRCDYASGPSPELWRKASSQITKNGSRVAWLAEDDPNYQLVSNGYFDYNYAWSFYDKMRAFAAGGSLADLRTACADLHNDSHYAGRSRMVFLSNHDRVQDDGGTEDRFFGANLKPMTVLEFTVYGMPLLYNGQEIGYKSGAVSLAEKTPVDWSAPDGSMTDLITTLCRLKHTQPALRTGSQNGTFHNLSTSADNDVYAYTRSLGDNHVVVMLNMAAGARTFTVSGALPDGEFTDAFSGATATFSTSATFTLPAHGYAVYVNGETGGITPPDPQQTRYIYLRDNSGWSRMYLYAYNESTGEIEDNAPFGAWPGTAVTDRAEADGVEYLRLEIPQWMSGRTYSLIANNADGSQTDLPATTLDGDVFLTVQPPQASYIYVLDRTGWNNVYIYGWADGQDELFGGWPGAQVSGEHIVDGVAYKRVQIPAARMGTAYNLIAHNNAGTQYDCISGRNIDGNIFLSLGAGSGSEIDVTTGAPDVAADGAPEPVYHTLGGQPVSMPSCGIFIETRGTISRKIIL